MVGPGQRSQADVDRAVRTARVVLLGVLVGGALALGALGGAVVLFDVGPGGDDPVGVSVNDNGTDEVTVTVVSDHGDQLVAVNEDGDVALVVGPVNEGATYVVDATGSNHSDGAAYTWERSGETVQTQLHVIDGELEPGDHVREAGASTALETIEIDG